MITIKGNKSKTKQYVIGTVAAIIILCFWISIPLMNNSSLDSSVASGNLFKSKTADISSLGNDIPQEGGAPGYALNGDLLNESGTTGESLASSLFQSGPEDETAAAEESASDSARPPAPLPGMSGLSGGRDQSALGRGKLSSMPSISGGGSNSMTAAGAHNKFFGTNAAKADFAPVSAQAFKNATAGDKQSPTLAMLQKTEEKSAQAAKATNLTAASGGATSAFERPFKADTSDLNTDMELAEASAGLALGAAAQDLKSNDPLLNKKKVTLPELTAVKTKDSDEEIKMMLIQMVISSVLGPMFATVFGAATAAGKTTAAGSTPAK